MIGKREAPRIRMQEDTACMVRRSESHADCRASGMAPASSAAPELCMEDLLRLPTSDEGAQQAVWDLFRSGKLDKTRLGEFLHNSAQAVVALPKARVVTKACLVSPSYIEDPCSRCMGAVPVKRLSE